MFGHRYDYIYKPLTGGSWLSANDGWQLSDTEILKAIACAHRRFFLGVRSGKASRFAVLDIDARSNYHNLKQLTKILQVVEAAGLKNSVLFRSSSSGGWHIYFFFSEPVSSRDLQKQFSNLLLLNGFKVEKGQLEIFPNPGERGSLGFGLRLPLQPGFAWLDKTTLETIYERDEIHPIDALGMFVADLQHCNSYQEFHKFKYHVEDLESRRADISTPPGAAKKTNMVVAARSAPANANRPEDSSIIKAVFGTSPPGINAASWLSGRNYFALGLAAPGQRADAIFCLGHYLFYGDPEAGIQPLGYGYEEERHWLIEKILTEKHNGQSKDINKGRSDAWAQIARAAHWLPPQRRQAQPPKYEPQVPLVWVRANAKRQQDARGRISAALAELKAGRRQFTFRELWKRSGCATDTLYKHQDIWRSDYDDLADGFFAADPGEYNAVEGVVYSKNHPPSTSLAKTTPLGLLAARRIAYELSLRGRREKMKLDQKTKIEKQTKEDSWKALVLSAIAESLDPNKTLTKLKAILAFLIFQLMLAPCEEDAIELQAAISQLKSLISNRIESSKLELVESGKPPPPA